MANNFVNNGSTYSYTPVSEVLAGQSIIINGMKGVAQNSVTTEMLADTELPDELKKVVLNLEGVYTLEVDSGSGAITAAGTVLYNAAGGKVSTVGSISIQVGTSYGAADAGYVPVMINKYF